MLVLLLALQAASVGAATGSPTPDVVVTGERLNKLHDRCRAGGCTPLRDARVSIAWAEAQLRDGAYVAAKTTLRDAVSRNKRYAKTDPKPVAAIYEAYATIAWQEGDQDIYRDAVAGRVRTLQGGLPANDLHVRAAALAYGDMWLRLGNPTSAEQAYRDAARTAAATGQDDVRLRALLARARVRAMMRDSAAANALLREAEALDGARDPGVRAAIDATRARVNLRRDEDVDAAVAKVREANLPGPALIWSPPVPAQADEAARRLVNHVPNAGAQEAVGASGLQSADVSAIRWADVGFWIRPDGHVAEVEVLRSSRARAWVAPYLAWVGARRYAISSDVAAQGTYRIERLTLRANYKVPKGSLIRRRTGESYLDVLDLTGPAARADPTS